MHETVNGAPAAPDKGCGGRKRAARCAILGLALAIATTLGGCYLDVHEHDHHGHYDHHGWDDHHDHDDHHNDHHDHY